MTTSNKKIKRVKRICANCKYAVNGSNSFGRDALECRRFPPMILNHAPDDCGFPLVDSRQWCGEFRKVTS